MKIIKSSINQSTVFFPSDFLTLVLASFVSLKFSIWCTTVPRRNCSVKVRYHLLVDVASVYGQSSSSFIILPCRHRTSFQRWCDVVSTLKRRYVSTGWCSAYLQYLKDTHWEKAPSNKSPAVRKSTNIGVWAVATSNQLLIRGS